jgi:hypothetical protein
MMQPTHFWDFPDQPKFQLLDRPRYQTIHLQRPVRAPMMVILGVTGQEPPERTSLAIVGRPGVPGWLSCRQWSRKCWRCQAMTVRD